MGASQLLHKSVAAEKEKPVRGAGPYRLEEIIAKSATLVKKQAALPL
jgi:hypothetical protein